MSRSAKVYMHDQYAGVLKRDEDGYSFIYDAAYLGADHPIPISFTLPLKKEAYQSNTMFSFFDGLIPEGWYLDVDASEIKTHDRMELLLALCKDCIGAVSIVTKEEVNHG